MKKQNFKGENRHAISVRPKYYIIYKYIIVLFVETPRKFITAKLSIRKPGSSSVLIICDLFNYYIISTDEDPGLRM